MRSISLPSALAAIVLTALTTQACVSGEVDYCKGYDPSHPVPADWISLDGGTFEMGSNDGQWNEGPMHTVTVPSFEIWRTEVTVEQYAQCVCSGTCAEPEHCGDPYSLRTYGFPAMGEHPNTCTRRSDANDFCTWAGGRLPTEAEWEYAARSGGQDILYPWGDEPITCDHAVHWEGGENDYGGCDEGATAEVCSRPDGNTDQGLCDMVGNVWEWAEDLYHDDYMQDPPTDGSAWGTPEEPDDLGVVRGGGYEYHPLHQTTTARMPVAPDEANTNGIRCVRTDP